MNTPRFDWPRLLHSIGRLARPREQLSALHTVMASYLSTHWEDPESIPLQELLRLSSGAIQGEALALHTVEMNRLLRESVEDLCRCLTFLVWRELQLLPVHPTESVRAHTTFDFDNLTPCAADVVQGYREVLNSMVGLQLRYTALRRFALLYRAAPRERRAAYQQRCEEIAAALGRTLEEGGQLALTGTAFREAVDQVREIRTRMQLQRLPAAVDAVRSDRREVASVHLVFMLNNTAMVAYEPRRVHFWCCPDWSHEVSSLNDLMQDVDIPPTDFDARASELCSRTETQLPFILGDDRNDPRLRTVTVIDHTGSRAPLARLLDPAGVYGQATSSETRDTIPAISFWGRITYEGSSPYFFDDRTRTIHSSTAAVIRYPDVPEKLRPQGTTSPLLLSTFERWFLEDRAKESQISLRLHCDSDASRDAFLQCHREANILHISTHGEAFPENWELSNLYFAAKKELPERVHVFDLLAIDWSHVDIVFLNACQSGSGRRARGEQSLSLGWAFLAGGAKAVIATRWLVEDRLAFEFMQLFYGAYLSGQERNTSAAFYAALQQLRLSDTFSKPSQWAAFMLMTAP